MFCSIGAALAPLVLVLRALTPKVVFAFTTSTSVVVLVEILFSRQVSEILLKAALVLVTTDVISSKDALVSIVLVVITSNDRRWLVLYWS